MDLRSSDLCSVSSTDEGNNTFHIIEAVYNEYVIFYQMIFGKGKKTEVIELNGKVFSY